MPSPLEKARKDPDSMKAKILAVAKRVFGQYGYHGATTRIIAKEVGIDISTLYYHWGEKNDLYEAVILDITEDLRQQLGRVEKTVRGRPLAERMDIAIDMMTDYLFQNSEIANLTFFRYFAKTREKMKWQDKIPDFVSDIARSMGIAEEDGTVSIHARMRILCMMNSIYDFISGEEFFRAALELERDEYIPLAIETLKFILIPAFAGVKPAA